MTANLMGLTARTGQQAAVPWTHLPRGCPPLAAGPPPRRVCFLGCSQTALRKASGRATFQTVTRRSKSCLARGGAGGGGPLCRARGSSPQEQTCHLRLQAACGFRQAPRPLASVLPCHKLQAGCFVLENLSLTPEGCACPSAQGHSPTEDTPTQGTSAPTALAPALGIILLWGDHTPVHPPAPHAASLVQKHVLLDARKQRSSPCSQQEKRPPWCSRRGPP